MRYSAGREMPVTTANSATVAPLWMFKARSTVKVRRAERMGFHFCVGACLGLRGRPLDTTLSPELTCSIVAYPPLLLRLDAISRLSLGHETEETTSTSSRPTPSISAWIRSPGFRNWPMEAPDPAGDPVKTMSPGSRVI